MTIERVTWDSDGLPDEVVVNGGAFLERMDGRAWFLEMIRADGTSFCVWFKGRILWTEERSAPMFNPAPAHPPVK
jgi:hypothetical protein